MRRRTGGATIVDSTASYRSNGSSSNAATSLVMGILFLSFFLICVMTQLTTNEAFLSGASTVDVFKPNWSIFIQPVALVQGHLSTSEGISCVFSFGIELLYLAFTMVGYGLIRNCVHGSAGRLIGIIFEILAFTVVAFNWYTDYNYGTLGSGNGGHIAFATLTAFVVGFFGTIGIFLVLRAWNRA